MLAELFLRGGKLNISLVFITQSDFLYQLLIIHQILNLYTKSTVKPYSLLVNDTTLASNNHLHLKRILKLIMTIDDKIRDEKTIIWYY